MKEWRACPACGNASVDRYKCVYLACGFYVLRCLDCELTFVSQDRAVDPDTGFNISYHLGAERQLLPKAVSDFQQLKAVLWEEGVRDFRGLRLLDVGCGIGIFLIRPRQEGWSVSGLELNQAAAAFATGNQKLNVMQGSITESTAFAEESFDVVTLYGVIEHLAKPVAAIRECARMLRPGGLLVIQTPTEDGMIRRVGRFLYWVSGGLINFHVDQLYQIGGGHQICFNRQSLKSFLGREGFEVLRIDQSTFGFRILLSRFEGSSLPERWLKSAGTALVFGLGRLFRASNHMTAYAKRCATLEHYSGVKRSGILQTQTG